MVFRNDVWASEHIRAPPNCVAIGQHCMVIPCLMFPCSKLCMYLRSICGNTLPTKSTASVKLSELALELLSHVSGDKC